MKRLKENKGDYILLIDSDEDSEFDKGELIELMDDFNGWVDLSQEEASLENFFEEFIQDEEEITPLISYLRSLPEDDCNEAWANLWDVYDNYRESYKRKNNMERFKENERTDRRESTKAREAASRIMKRGSDRERICEWLEKQSWEPNTNLNSSTTKLNQGSRRVSLREGKKEKRMREGIFDSTAEANYEIFLHLIQQEDAKTIENILVNYSSLIFDEEDEFDIDHYDDSDLLDQDYLDYESISVALSENGINLADEGYGFLDEDEEDEDFEEAKRNRRKALRERRRRA
jgi:hypothetical protein